MGGPPSGSWSVLLKISIRPILEEDLSGVAAFVERHVAPGAAAATDAAAVTAREARLRHRLFENPARPAEIPVGHVLRDEADGRILGTSLVFPWRFLWGDRPLLGMGGGGLYVEPVARMQGFLLFRRLFSLKTADFWFATTCNAASAPLWFKSRAAPVPGSGRELHRVIRPGPLAREVALRRRLGSGMVALAGAAGDVLGAVLKPRPARVDVRMEETTDWEKMSGLAERNRDRDRIVCDRSVDYLRWSYERSVDQPPPRLLTFDASGGREGWFAIGSQTRGTRGQISDATLLDWSIPRGLDPGVALAAASNVVLAEGRADTFSVQGRVDLPAPPAGAGFRSRVFAVPTGWVVGRETPGEDLACRIVLAAADRF